MSYATYRETGVLIEKMPVPDLSAVNLSMYVESVDVTTFADHGRSFLPGLQSFELELETFHEPPQNLWDAITDRQGTGSVEVIVQPSGFVMGKAGFCVPAFDGQACRGCGSLPPGERCLFCGRINNESCRSCSAPDYGHAHCLYCGSGWPGREGAVSLSRPSVDNPRISGSFMPVHINHWSSAGELDRYDIRLVSTGPVKRETA